MEVVCRRIQAIVDAYSHPSRPSWENAKIFAGQGSPEDIVSPSFRSYAAKRNKDELELLQARQKVRELRGSPAIPIEEGDPSDALPSKQAVRGRAMPEGEVELGQDPPLTQPGAKDWGEGMRQPGAAAFPSRAERKLFPLPHVACPSRKIGVSRREQQRRDRIRKAAENVNEAIDSVNWLSGVSAAGVSSAACGRPGVFAEAQWQH